ncbi:MAG: tRNA pseudouridine(55) synthase TruB [Ilumatobacteraceae bacterium]|nr:tRNA pseudouridine(55) synthase TruB [Ilumatobacteraceae bacterium]
MARRKPPTRHGLVIVDKPSGMTSHDVVSVLRKQLGERRIGHAGTLDPDATGVLLVGVGYVTRLLTFLSGLDKTYTAQIVLGSSTSTLDSSGTVTATHDMSSISVEDVQRVVKENFVGKISQVPPMVSALKVDGVRLHELARQGIEVERAARELTIHGFKVFGMSEPGVIDVEVHCSSGTYIRSLADDVGRALGGSAHLRNLRRISVGGFSQSECSNLEDPVVHPPITAVRTMSRVVADEQMQTMIKHGRELEKFDSPAPWVLVDDENAVLAVYELGPSGRAKPSVVMANAVA